MRRMIDADKLLEALRRYPVGTVTDIALSTVEHCIYLQTKEQSQKDSWRNPEWEEREKENRE